MPGLSSAVLDEYQSKFTTIDSLSYGISPGQKAERGLATTKSILSYVGKKLKPILGSHKTRYGWQDNYIQEYPIIGNRMMANCDIPDLDLFTQKYGIKDIRFSAGMESRALHLGILLVASLVKAGLPLNLPKYAGMLLKISNLFDWLGSDDGGMHMIINGVDKEGQAKQIKWFIIAKDGDGTQIPTIPAIILAKKIIAGEFDKIGAMPCMSLISLEEYLTELKKFNIEVIIETESDD